MEVWIAANILMTLAFHFRPNQAYQMTDVASTIERTVTSRPIVFGTVYDDNPSTSEAPFKPSKQLFDQILTTEKPPETSPGDIRMILEPTNTRMEPSEALHINLFTLPTDSLNYNLLLGQPDMVGVDPKVMEDVQQTKSDSKYPKELSFESLNEDVAEIKPVKKEVHYHQHRHFHGYVSPDEQLASNVSEHYHESEKIEEDREDDYEHSHSNVEEHDYLVPENVLEHEMKKKQEEYHQGYVSEPELADYEHKNEDPIHREHSHMQENGAVYKYRVPENVSRRSHRRKEKQEVHHLGYVSEPGEDSYKHINEHSHKKTYRVPEEIVEHAHQTKKKQGEHHIGYVSEPGRDSFKHINEHSHKQAYRVPEDIIQHSHQRKKKQGEHHIGYVGDPGEDSYKQGYRVPDDFPGYPHRRKEKKEEHHLRYASEPGEDNFKDVREHFHIQEHDDEDKYRFHDNVPEDSHRRQKKQEVFHRGYESEHDEDDHKHMKEHYHMHEHEDYSHERIPGERENKSESSRKQRRRNRGKKRDSKRSQEDYLRSNVHKRRRHNKQKSSSQPIVVKVREEYKLERL